MSARSPKRSFAARPADPEDWIKVPDRHATRTQPAEDFSARLTIDVTTDMRGRIKNAAFQRGQTNKKKKKKMFEREFPPPSGEG